MPNITLSRSCRLAALLALALAPHRLAASSGVGAGAAASPPVPATVWDRIMAEQSLRNLETGYLLMESERYAEASAEFLKSIARTPREPYAHILYGASLYWLGDPEKAMSEFKTAVELDPSNSMAYQLMGIVHAWKGEFADAAGKFVKAMSLAPERGDVRMNAGSVYSAMGEMDKALEHLRQAVRLDPGNPLYSYQLGLLYARLGRVSDAKSSFKRALSLFGEYEDAMLELAVMEEKDGNSKEAARLYRRALGIKPGDNVVRFRLGCLLLRTGETKRLGALLEEAFLLTPSNSKGGISISLAYAGGPVQGDGGSGRDGSLEQAISRVPKDEDITIKAEFISIPRPELTERAEGGQGKLGAGLEAGFKRADVRYLRREYSLPASDIARRGARASQIASEVEAALKAAAGEGLDTRMSINIETKKSAASPGGSQADVVYKPRDVGNDMGLWVMGANWVEHVEEALEELDGPDASYAKDQAAGLLRGLGSLILGEPDAALEEFDRSHQGPAADLGRCAAWVEKGSRERALAACLKALERDPENRTALANKRWLTGEKNGKRKP